MICRKTIKELSKSLNSSILIFPDHKDWPQANRKFGLHIFTPLAILQAKEWGDISKSIKFCNKHLIPFAIKGGGVNQSSSCVRKDALTIDLSYFKNIKHKYNGSELEITLESGINFKNLLDHIQRFNQEENVGFITPMAWYEQISCIGAFCILGNGIAHRKIGFGVDLIRQAKVLLSSGQIITANQQENSDVLWAIRGCGPHIGAILQMTIKMDKNSFDHLKVGEKNILRVHSLSIPFSQSTIGLQKHFLEFLTKLDPRFLCYFGFSGNWKQANIYLILSQILTNNLSQDYCSKQSQQGKQLKQLVKLFQGKNNFVGKQFLVCPINGFLIPKTKEKYYKTWGFYSKSSQLNQIIQKIFEFYLKNSINSQDQNLEFNFSLNYFGSQIFEKRQSSKTCVPTLQQETFLIYGNISYSIAQIESEAELMIQKLEQQLERYMPLGSPCDYDPEKARRNPSTGKWIYRQNYERLKEIKKRVDPLNHFDYGLFH